jgi:catechol 2,3-dioxygenase-like lactoylglutathione lyase family enzyme
MEMNGIAHIQLTVNDFAGCRKFYAKLFGWLEMRVIFDSEEVFYGVGSRTGISISPADRSFGDARFEQRRIGLHHFCLRARSREDVDALHELLRSAGVRIVHPPEEGGWAPGYYSVLFEDPDGIRIEANHVPGKGHLSADVAPPIEVGEVSRTR